MAFLGPAIWDWISGADKERERARRDAAAAQQQATDAWDELAGQVPTAASQQLAYGVGQDVSPYGVNDPTIDPAYQQWIGRPATEWMDKESAYAGMGPSRYDQLGDSEFADMDSAYAGLGPSAYEKMGPNAYEELGPSAFADMAPSAYGDLEFDEGRMADAEDYFGDLSKSGTDEIADADYERGARQAGAARAAATKGALEDAEMRGQGGGGSALLGELMAAQGEASDLYQLGLDRAAAGARRRDTSAQSLADIAERRGRGELDADTSRAAGLDEWGQAHAQGLDEYGLGRAEGLETSGAARAAGLDEYGINRAAGLDKNAVDQATGIDKYALDRAAGGDDYALERSSGLDDFSGKQYDAIDDWRTQSVDDLYKLQEANVRAANEAQAANVQRQQGVNDRNVDLWNDTTYQNKVTAPQREFDNRTTTTAGQTGQYNLTSDAAKGEENRLRDQTAQRGQAIDQTAQNVFTYGAASGWGGKDKDKNNDGEDDD